MTEMTDITEIDAAESSNVEAPKTDVPSTTPWSPFSAVMLAIVAYIVASVVGSLLVVGIGIVSGRTLHNVDDWLNDSTLAQFLSTLLVYALMGGIVYWFVQVQKGSIRLLGVRRPRMKDFGVSLLAAPVYIVAYIAILSIATYFVPGLNTDQQQQLGFKPDGLHPILILTFLSLVVLPPLVEEFIMRGFVFTSLLKRCKFWLATLITSLLFASAHLQFGSGAPLLWVAAIDTFVLSLVLCFVRYKTGSLWPGIGLHALKNFVAFYVLFLSPFIHVHGQGIMTSSMIMHGLHYVHSVLPLIPA